MRSIQFHAFGDPGSVRLIDQPSEPIGAGDVRITMEAAPLNPSDFLLLDGHYGIRPDLPSPVGAEGVGAVAEIGGGVTRASVGQRVLILPSDTLGTWQDEIVVDQRHVVPVHREVDPVQLATVPINAATAHLLVDHGAGLAPGSWLLQTAANSGLGAFVRVLAARAGLRLIDVVRTEVAASALRDAGAEHVVVADATLSSQLTRLLGDDRISLLLDGVGGPLIDDLLPHVAVSGQLVSFAALSGRPITLPAGELNFKGLHVHGFWLHHWLTSAPQDEIDRTYAELVDLVADGALRTPVQATFALDEYQRAIADARSYGRAGKVVFTAAAGSSR